jgi:hypothetical protein
MRVFDGLRRDVRYALRGAPRVYRTLNTASSGSPRATARTPIDIRAR